MNLRDLKLKEKLKNKEPYINFNSIDDIYSEQLKIVHKDNLCWNQDQQFKFLKWNDIDDFIKNNPNVKCTVETIEQCASFKKNPSFGSKTDYIIQKNGDLCTNMYLQVNLPLICK